MSSFVGRVMKDRSRVARNTLSRRVFPLKNNADLLITLGTRAEPLTSHRSRCPNSAWTREKRARALSVVQFPRARRDGGCGARHRREGWPSRVLPGEDRGVRARREGQDLEPAAPRGAEERAQPERCVKPLSARRRRWLERVSDLNATDRGTGGWLALFADAHAHALPGRDTAARTPRNRGDAPPGPCRDRPPASRHGSHHTRSLALKGSFRCSYFCGFRGPDSRRGNQKRRSPTFSDFFSRSRASSGRLSSQSALCARRSSTFRSPGRTWARW